MTVTWKTTGAEAAGFAANLERKFDAGLESGLLRDFHAVALSRNDELVMERYFEGRDEAWGDDIGHVVFGPDTLHDLRSVTKSVSSLLYGIALEQGLVPALDAPVVDAFPEYPDLVGDPVRRKITVEHTLNMTMGMEWDENRPYTDPLNSEIAMEHAPDRYRFILDRPIIGAPGEKWIYSGGAVALIGALLTRGTGKSLTAFAQETLFGPLGIDDFFWCAGADGAESAASGLRMTTRGLLRIGAMMANGGVHEGRQIVPKAWIDACMSSAIATDYDTGYSRLWYTEVARTGFRGHAHLGRRLRQWRPAALGLARHRDRGCGLSRQIQRLVELDPTDAVLARDRHAEFRADVRNSDQLTTSPSVRASAVTGLAGRRLLAARRYICATCPSASATACRS